MKKSYLLTVIALLLNQSVFASSDLAKIFAGVTDKENVCYSRAYTNAELSDKYPNKKITAISLELFRDNALMKMTLTARIKAESNEKSNTNGALTFNDIYQNNLICVYSEAEEKDICTVEGSDHFVRIESRNEGTTLKITNESLEDIGRISATPEVFRLEKTDCAGLARTIAEPAQ